MRSACSPPAKEPLPPRDLRACGGRRGAVLFGMQETPLAGIDAAAVDRRRGPVPCHPCAGVALPAVPARHRPAVVGELRVRAETRAAPAVRRDCLDDGAGARGAVLAVVVQRVAPIGPPRPRSRRSPRAPASRRRSRSRASASSRVQRRPEAPTALGDAEVDAVLEAFEAAGEILEQPVSGETGHVLPSARPGAGLADQPQELEREAVAFVFDGRLPLLGPESGEPGRAAGEQAQIAFANPGRRSRRDPVASRTPQACAVRSPCRGRRIRSWRC